MTMFYFGRQREASWRPKNGEPVTIFFPPITGKGYQRRTFGFATPVVLRL
jgi:hypothetical protein